MNPWAAISLFLAGVIVGLYIEAWIDINRRHTGRYE